jgi:DNA repair protein RecN (Recombination protein N)
MLLQLLIRDFVIVDHLDLEFAAGFGALTGETGAGKSILIDALALALGERADADVVRQGADKAEVTAVFDIAALPTATAWLAAHDLGAEESLILRRVVDAGGRSRAYINGSPAPAQQLREVAELLVDIHGQHAHQSLLRGDAQRVLLDAAGDLDALVHATGESWKNWRDAEQRLRAATSDSEAQRLERERLQWLVEELSDLALAADEWPLLEAEHARLAHAASLIEGARFALAVLSEGETASERQIDAVAERIAELSDYDPALAEANALLQSVQAELGEVTSFLRRYADRVDLDPARLGEVEARLDAVMACARKQRCTPAELPLLLVDARTCLDQLTEAADLAALEARVLKARDEYRELAERLSAGRAAAAARLGAAVSELMAELALGRGRFEIALLPLDVPAAHGLEQIEFRVGGLAADEAKPLAKVASGGELSRISLAIQVVTARAAQVPTLIFDEVDVGIGGGVAEIVGRMLHGLGRERQVLCVTHLPQVAARADWQWQVSKEEIGGRVLSRIVVLDAGSRVEEVARMLGGVEITETTRRHARELLGN